MSQFFAIPYYGTSGLPVNNPTFTGQALGPNGSAGAPTYSFTAHPTYGMYYDNTNSALGFSVAGTEVAYVNSNSIVLPNSSSTVQVQADVYVNQQSGTNVGVRFGANGNGSAMSLCYSGTSGVYYLRQQFTGAFSQFIIQGRYTLAKTTSYTIVAADTGTTFTNAGAAGSVTFTLPASPTLGESNSFMLSAAQTVIISGGSNSVVWPGLATGTSRTSSTQYASATVTWDGTVWIGTSILGTWT